MKYVACIAWGVLMSEAFGLTAGSLGLSFLGGVIIGWFWPTRRHVEVLDETDPRVRDGRDKFRYTGGR